MLNRFRKSFSTINKTLFMSTPDSISKVKEVMNSRPNAVVSKYNDSTYQIKFDDEKEILQAGLDLMHSGLYNPVVKTDPELPMEKYGFVSHLKPEDKTVMYADRNISLFMR